MLKLSDMNIILGTSNDYKLKLLKEVLAELDIKVGVSGVDIKSGVPDQPIGNLVTKRGAVNRARGAYAAGSSVRVGIGLEVGYEKNKSGLLEMMCWAAVYDGEVVYTTKSHGLLLPKFHQEVLDAGGYLGEHVRNFNPDASSKVEKVLKEIIIYREPFLRMAAHNAVLIYFNRTKYS